MKTKNRKKYMNFTMPYLSTPLVMANRPDVQFISDMKQIKGKKIGVVKDYAFNEILRKKFPNIKIVDVKNIEAGLQQVIDKKLFGFIGSLDSIGYLFQTKFTGELKISIAFNKDLKLHIAVRNDNPILLNILNKTVHNIFKHKDMPKSTFKNMWDTIKSEKTWRGEIKNKNKDGSFYWADVTINPDYNANGSLKGYTAIRQDITDKKKFETTSITDALTQIPNRLHLNSTYKIELEKTKRYNSIFSTIIMDIDHFKNVNDTYGHDIGDIVLVEMANILKDNTRDTDTIGRWGGEEFLIICPHIDANQAKIYAQKIKEKINSFDFTTVGSATCSFGISW